MTWTSAISSAADLARAAREVTEEIRYRLGGVAPDLIVAFVSEHHRSSFPALPRLLREPLGEPTLVGCSARAVIGDGREVEERPGLSVTAALLPDVSVSARHFTMTDLPGGTASPESWRAAIPRGEAPVSGLLVLADPFTFDTERVLSGLDAVHPEATTIGGLASGSEGPGRTSLFLDDAVAREGALVASFSGAITVEAAVSQGCRPIGEPMFVTKCRRHLLQKIDDTPVLDVLKTLFESLGEQDKLLFRESIFLGISTRSKSLETRPEDFLVRNVLGMRSTDKALAVGVRLEPGQIVQFHVRDAETAAHDLEATLTRIGAVEGAPEGVLLFSCLGRGMRLFGTPDHDTDAFRRLVGPSPLGGFFCNGEIGPVAGSTYLHGYTSSFGLFRSKQS